MRGVRHRSSWSSYGSRARTRSTTSSSAFAWSSFARTACWRKKERSEGLEGGLIVRRFFPRPWRAISPPSVTTPSLLLLHECGRLQPGLFRVVREDRRASADGVDDLSSHFL